MLGQLPNVISMLHLTTLQPLIGAIHFVKSHSDCVVSVGNMKLLGRSNSKSLMVTQIVNMQLDGTRSKPIASAFILSPEVDIVFVKTTSRVCTLVTPERRRIGRNKASILRVIVALGVEEPETRTISQILVAGVRNGAFAKVLADLEDSLVVLGELKEVPGAGQVPENLTILLGEFIAITVIQLPGTSSLFLKIVVGGIDARDCQGSGEEGFEDVLEEHRGS